MLGVDGTPLTNLGFRMPKIVDKKPRYKIDYLNSTMFGNEKIKKKTLSIRKLLLAHYPFVIRILSFLDIRKVVKY